MHSFKRKKGDPKGERLAIKKQKRQQISHPSSDVIYHTLLSFIPLDVLHLIVKYFLLPTYNKFFLEETHVQAPIAISNDDNYNLLFKCSLDNVQYLFRNNRLVDIGPFTQVQKYILWISQGLITVYRGFNHQYSFYETSAIHQAKDLNGAKFFFLEKPFEIITLDVRDRLWYQADSFHYDRERKLIYWNGLDCIGFSRISEFGLKHFKLSVPSHKSYEFAFAKDYVYVNISQFESKRSYTNEIWVFEKGEQECKYQFPYKHNIEVRGLYVFDDYLYLISRSHILIFSLSILQEVGLLQDLHIGSEILKELKPFNENEKFYFTGSAAFIQNKLYLVIETRGEKNKKQHICILSGE